MYRDKTYDEKRALRLLAEGNENGFTIVFDQYRARIFSVALRFLKSRELAEDVVQEVFLKIWVRRNELDKVLDFERYLLAIARNHVFDRIKNVAAETNARKEVEISRHTECECASASDRPLIEKQYEEFLHKAVNDLPPQQKQIFQLAKVEGLSHQLIAEQLNISRFTVKTHMAKALQTIRQTLEHHITSNALFPLALPILYQLF